RGEADRTHAALAEAPGVVEAVDEAVAVVALVLEAVPRHHGADFPAVGQAVAERGTDARQVIVHRPPVAGRRNHDGRFGGLQRISIDIDAEGDIAVVQRVPGHDIEEAGLAACRGRNERDLVGARHRHALREKAWYYEETKESKEKPRYETQQVTPPKTIARRPLASV